MKLKNVVLKDLWWCVREESGVGGGDGGGAGEGELGTGMVGVCSFRR